MVKYSTYNVDIHVNTASVQEWFHMSVPAKSFRVKAYCTCTIFEEGSVKFQYTITVETLSWTLTRCTCRDPIKSTEKGEDEKMQDFHHYTNH